MKGLPVRVATTRKPGTELRFRSATYIIAPDGSYRRLGIGKRSKAEKKALKRKKRLGA